MNYFGMPFGMWTLLAKSFRTQLTKIFGYNDESARDITHKAKAKYKEIISELPEFEKGDRFKMNLVNCAMIGAFILSMPQRPEMDSLTDYYAKSMMTTPMQWFCRKSGKSKFTAKDIAAMKATAALKAADRNPYSWNMGFYEYPDGSGYEGRFTKCGSCVQTAGICQHDLFDFRHRNCLRSNQLIYFSISLVQFHDCSVHYPGTWKMCKKCSVYSSNMKAVFHSGAL